MSENNENGTKIDEVKIDEVKKARMNIIWTGNKIAMYLVGCGKTVETFEGDCTELPANIFVECKASQHGIEQKLRDNLAMSKETREVTTALEQKTKTEELWNNLKAGNWNIKGKEKAETLKVSDIEAQFVNAVRSGVMEYAQAKAIYEMTVKKPFTKTEEEIIAE